MIQRTVPDTFILSEPALGGRWVQTFARWIVLGRPVLADEPVARMVTEQLRVDFNEDAIAADVTLLDTPQLMLTDHNEDFFIRGQCALLIEAPVLMRRTPNPFPTFVVSPLVLSIETRLRAAVRRIRFTIKRKAIR